VFELLKNKCLPVLFYGTGDCPVKTHIYCVIAVRGEQLLY